LEEVHDKGRTAGKQKREEKRIEVQGFSTVLPFLEHIYIMYLGDPRRRILAESTDTTSSQTADSC